MGPDIRSWLGNLPISWQTGNVAVVHAGADPSEPLVDQSRRSLLWGHQDFDRLQRTDGIWIVHGHTIVDQPFMGGGRISIDIGAYATGRLAAVHIANGTSQFNIIK